MIPSRNFEAPASWRLLALEFVAAACFCFLGGRL